MRDDECKEQLNECLTTIRHLEEENRQLRLAAATFGQLAERLNERLIRERRIAERDRRGEARPDPERRARTSADG